MLFPCMKRCKGHSLKYTGLLEIIGIVVKLQGFWGLGVPEQQI